MIDVDFDDRLKVNHATKFRLGLVLIVEQRATFPVEDEPSTIPRLEFHSSHLVKKSSTRTRGQLNLRRINEVSRTFDVSTKIEIQRTDRKITCQRTFLHTILLSQFDVSIDDGHLRERTVQIRRS